jgi:hypothetical protein
MLYFLYLQKYLFMKDFTIDFILHFYNEAIKHKPYSSEFLENSKHITLMYREKFGMNETWLNYHDINTKNEELNLSLFKKMYNELLKFYNF